MLLSCGKRQQIRLGICIRQEHFYYRYRPHRASVATSRYVQKMFTRQITSVAVLFRTQEDDAFLIVVRTAILFHAPYACRCKLRQTADLIKLI
jgi:mRNA deadenylase 3'-5' endonuclease subunit Ccr4